MEKIDRLQQLHRILKTRRHPVNTRLLADELECTEKTVRRYIDTLRNLLHAPIINVPRKGWQYDNALDTFELPGIWFTSRDLISFSTILKIIHEMDSDLIDTELNAVIKQIHQLLKNKGINPDSFDQKIKILPTNKQILNSSAFNTASEALINKQQLIIHYQGYSGKKTNRTISPQQLVYYQENWYLDSYCHLRQALRQFKISRLLKVELLNKKAKRISKKQLNEHFAQSYGIFAGKAKHTAKLVFFDDAAREVALQQWHPQQTGEWNGQEYTLSFPYNDDRELIRDILKYANKVEVISPAKLKNKVKRIIYYMGEMYR